MSHESYGDWRYITCPDCGTRYREDSQYGHHCTGSSNFGLIGGLIAGGIAASQLAEDGDEHSSGHRIARAGRRAHLGLLLVGLALLVIPTLFLLAFRTDEMVGVFAFGVAAGEIVLFWWLLAWLFRGVVALIFAPSRPSGEPVDDED